MTRALNLAGEETTHVYIFVSSVAYALRCVLTENLRLSDRSCRREACHTLRVWYHSQRQETVHAYSRTQKHA